MPFAEFVAPVRHILSPFGYRGSVGAGSQNLQRPAGQFHEGVDYRLSLGRGGEPGDADDHEGIPTAAQPLRALNMVQVAEYAPTKDSREKIYPGNLIRLRLAFGSHVRGGSPSPGPSATGGRAVSHLPWGVDPV